MSNRIIKQIIYGSFYLVIFGALIWGFYVSAIRPAPSCFDNKKNQGEEEIDCGGKNCESCEIRHLSPIRTLPALLLTSPEAKKSTLLIQFQNPNVNWGAESFSYAVNLYDSANTVIYSLPGDSFIYPSEIKYRVEANIPVENNRVARSEVTIANIKWKQREQFSRPDVSTREVKVEKLPERGLILVRGIARNDNSFALSKVTINAIIFSDLGSLVGVSKTLLLDMAPSQERSFQITVPITAAPSVELREPKLAIEAQR